jgi:hypothetical protein
MRVDQFEQRCGRLGVILDADLSGMHRVVADYADAIQRHLNLIR